MARPAHPRLTQPACVCSSRGATSTIRISRACPPAPPPPSYIPHQMACTSPAKQHPHHRENVGRRTASNRGHRQELDVRRIPRRACERPRHTGNVRVTNHLDALPCGGPRVARTTCDCGGPRGGGGGGVVAPSNCVRGASHQHARCEKRRRMCVRRGPRVARVHPQLPAHRERLRRNRHFLGFRA